MGQSITQESARHEELLKELDSSEQNNIHRHRTNVLLTCIVIILSTMSLVLTAFGVYYTYKNSTSEKELERLKERISEQSSVISKLSEHLNDLDNQLKNLKKHVQSNTRNTDEKIK